MVSNFLLTKNDPEVRKNAYKNTFGSIVVPKVVTEDETVQESLKRVLGDKLVSMKDVHVIEGIIQNECIFEPKSLKENMKVLSFITQAISNIFQGFMGVIGNTATKELVDSTAARFCVASTSNNYVETMITLNDLGEIAEYVNGVPMVLKNYKGILKLSKDIDENRKALQNAPDQNAANNINAKLNQDYKDLSDYYYEIINGFFKMIKDKLGIESDKIVDITVVFEKSTNTEDGEVINCCTFVQMHSAYNLIVRDLKDSMI